MKPKSNPSGFNSGIQPKRVFGRQPRDVPVSRAYVAFTQALNRIGGKQQRKQKREMIYSEPDDTLEGEESGGRGGGGSLSPR
jgi:hypothetical protein